MALDRPEEAADSARGTAAPARAETEEEKQKRLEEAERRENEVYVPPQRRTDSLPPTEDLAAAALAAKVSGGITRLDVIRDSDVAASSVGDKPPSSARSGSRAGEKARTI